MRTTLAILVAGLAFGSTARAEVTRGMGGLVAIDSTSSVGSFSLGASELTLATGATEDAVVLSDSPSDDGSITDYSINGIARFDMLPYQNSGGTEVNIESNGYLSFDRANRGECRGDFDNTDLVAPPVCRAKRLLAFWDDLLPSDSSTITRGHTAGTGDDFWYFQWNDFALVDNPDARISFRVTYFENGDYIRVNYIRLEGAGSDGSGATIGITQCHRRNRDQERNRLVWSFNEASLPSGNAVAGSSIYAIEFGFDSDGDGLADHRELALGTNPSLFDTDGCGEGDGAEVLAGRDPLTANCALSPDDVTADTDNDGLPDTDEQMVGTDPAVADTDGDLAPDFEELTVMGTNPFLADTDGDGFDDGVEDADFDGVVDSDEDDNKNGILDVGEDNDGDDELDFAESDPLDPSDVAGMDLLAGSGLRDAEPNHTDSFVDGDGNVYLITEERDDDDELVFVKVMADGTIANPAVNISLQGLEARKPHIGVRDGVITVVFMAHAGSATDGELTDVRIGVFQFTDGEIDTAPAGVKGSVRSFSPVVRTIEVPGVPTHWHAAFDNSGMVHAVYDDHGRNHGDGEEGVVWVRYVVASPVSGSLIRQTVLAEYDRRLTPSEYRNHRVHDPRVVIDRSGAAHIVWLSRTAPSNFEWDPVGFPTGAYYVMAEPGGQIHGPAYIDHGVSERIEIALHPTEPVLYYAASNGDTDNAEDIGFRFGVLDAASISFVPRVEDFFGVRWAISSSSFITPIRAVLQPDNDYTGPELTVLADGNAVMTNYDGSQHIAVLSPYGELLAEFPAFRITGGNDYKENRRRPAIPFGDGVAFVQSTWSGGDWRWSAVPGSAMNLVAPDPFNSAPVFGAMPQNTSVRAGARFSHVPEISDAESTDLSLTLSVAPNGMTIDGDGAVVWEPTSADVGDHAVVLRACDDDARQRCAEQGFVVTVIANTGDLGPRIVSTPAGEAYATRNYSYLLQVEDVELPNDSFSYAITSGQSGNMEIDNDGLFTWSPQEDELGVWAVQLTVTDSSGRSAAQNFSVTVLSKAAAQSGGAPLVSLEDGCAQSGTNHWAGLLAALALLMVVARRKEMRGES